MCEKIANIDLRTSLRDNAKSLVNLTFLLKGWDLMVEYNNKYKS